MRKVFRTAVFAILAAGLHLQPALAQGQSTKPLKFIVPYSPGGLPDTVARILAKYLPEELGQSVIVDNKPGASGAIAAAALAQSPADGDTMLITDGPLLAIYPLLVTRPAYDLANDFVPVSLVGKAPLFLAVHPSVKANNIDELVALAKKKPGALNYASSGVGSIHHLTAEAMKSELGIFLTHIPFKGSSVAVPAMIGGQVDMVFSSPPSLMGFVKTGQAKLIAINSVKRSPLAPDVPALAEKIKGFDFAFNVAALARKGSPAPALERVSAAIAKVVRKPEVIEQLRTAGVEPVGSSPAELQQALASEGTRVRAAAKRANLKAE
ncbi:MAG: tripartite tricarboxylate transporter substrate-binding protein [Burkholderiaceae bacterium]|nr:tripartite tricarboxylate transporter substrate-binding protein [Burkholderiaceae bacterium]MDP3753292.1 tripartite tricarboxylate transporter substrate-binding protein [Polaromonas sp.]